MATSMMKQLVMLTGVALTLQTGCATTKPAPQLCQRDADLNVRSAPTPDVWFALLLHGYDKERNVVPRPAVDCSGAPVVWQDPVLDECREAGPPSEPLPPAEKLTEEDLVMVTTQARERLVWVITRRYTNGEGVGPVARVLTTETGFSVEALGTLRALPLRAQLRMEHVAGTEVLVAEGDACTTDASEEQVCRRAVRIMPLRSHRFFGEAVSSKNKACLGAAWFPLSRELSFTLPSGLRRTYELASTVSFKADGITVQEQVQVTDSDPTQPAVAPRLYRRAQDHRELTVQDNVLQGSAPSLWVRMIEQQLLAGAKPLPEQEVLPRTPPSVTKEAAPKTASGAKP
ncbi:hypothetical protein D7X74_15745 [Corallococcus sp. CA047B]|uniref:hypothetical protein n=1 Tax=Corallococcus sp. CA047B TaxID=2316729 RepID=UPI000EA08466|nr:hypothetical protein [Corallococcus sp. CA047B]RKH16350.1 hypothetical protein D7X74_15745 [Corallococcus sp. CA047B]